MMIGLNILLLIGAGAVFVGVFRLFSPAEEKDAIVDIAVRKYKSASSFARLDPESKLLDRVAVFCLRTFHLEDSLETMYLQLGSPDKPQPVDILYTKIIVAVILPAAMMLLFKSFWPIILVPVGFMLPDVFITSKIQKRQAEILANFSTTVDLAALIIESGLDYLTAFERIIKIAKEKTNNIIVIPPTMMNENVLKGSFSYMFDESSIIKSKEVGKIFKQIAAKNHCKYFDINEFATPSNIDGLHYDEKSHKLIANKLTKLIKLT